MVISFFIASFTVLGQGEGGELVTGKGRLRVRAELFRSQRQESGFQSKHTGCLCAFSSWSWEAKPGKLLGVASNLQLGPLDSASRGSMSPGLYR